VRRTDGLEEDLLQEVYCRLLDRGAQRLRRCRERDERAIRAYLARLAQNAAIDHLRWRHTVKRGRRSLVPFQLAERRLEQATDHRPSVEERLILQQQGRCFVRACRRIVGGRTADRNVRILALAFLGGLSSREISRRMGSSLSPGSIDSLISRARKKLAAQGLAVAARR
jgi:RNA polymerase sigma factor (sigma-70 family)